MLEDVPSHLIGRDVGLVEKIAKLVFAQFYACANIIHFSSIEKQILSFVDFSRQVGRAAVFRVVIKHHSPVLQFYGRKICPSMTPRMSYASLRVICV